MTETSGQTQPNLQYNWVEKNDKKYLNKQLNSTNTSVTKIAFRNSEYCVATCTTLFYLYYFFNFYVNSEVNSERRVEIMWKSQCTENGTVGIKMKLIKEESRSSFWSFMKASTFFKKKMQWQNRGRVLGGIRRS